MVKVVRSPEAGQAVYVAVDVSRSKWAFNVRWGGAERRRFSTCADLRHIGALIDEYRGFELHLAYEACGFGYEIAWFLRERGVDVTVVAPSTVERAPGLAVKTDRLDARSLAEKLEKGSLKSAHVPTREDHARRQLSRTYDQAMKEKKRAQARVRALLQEQGRLGPAPTAGWAAYERWLATQEMPAAVRKCIEELVGMRKSSLESARRLKRVLGEVAREEGYAPTVSALATQAGVGEFTAVRLRLELGDMRRFSTAGSFANYLGLTPSEYSSGDNVLRGHIAKRGPGQIRAWLIQCAWASIRPGQPDAELRECFQRIRVRAGDKRAIVAVARRLALRLRARWLEQTEKAA